MLEVINRINTHGFKAYLVGGAIRDMFLKQENQDLDIFTTAPLDVVKTLFKDAKIIDVEKGTLFLIYKGTYYEIYSFENELEYDEQRLNDIMKRLETIQNLKRKYGNSIDEILQYEREITKRYQKIKSRDKMHSNLELELAKLEQAILMEGKQLSRIRRDIAMKLEKEIYKQLKDLYMENAQFVVRFSGEIDDYTIADAQKNGLDTVEFFVSTNPGEPLKPLVKVASGGELSRLMLAIKSVFSSKQGVTSVIFDEIDTGVSGRVAQAIANKMHNIAQDTQVLAVSHLPQVAAASDHHLFVQKKVLVDQNRTITEVVKLTEEERIREIARMLSGEEITTAALEAARDLIKNKTS